MAAIAPLGYLNLEAAVMTSIASAQDHQSGRAYVLYEAFAVGAILALAVWSIRPLLEEWSAFFAFNALGTGVLVSHYEVSPLRPLHIVPYWLQWLAAGGAPVGVGILCGLLMVLRYFVVRWAVSPLITGPRRIIFALMCTVCVGWEALWLGRFSPAQISSIFFFAALGCSIRLARRPSKAHMAGAAGSILLMLPFYQAPLLVAGLLPFMAAFGCWSDNSPGSALRRFLRVGIPLLLGVVIYVGYSALMYARTGTGYEAELALSGWTSLWLNVTQVYRSIFVASPQIVVMYGLIVFAFSSAGSQRAGSATPALVWPYLSLLCLPLLSLIYTSSLHTNDPERVLFPFFLGFSLVALQVLARATSSAPAGDDRRMLLLALPLMAWAAVCAAQVRSAWTLQSYVVRATAAFATVHNAKSVAIVDETGLLGDVYSFLPDTLTHALQVQGHAMKTTICTPLDVDRLHPVARRYPISTTPRCEGDSGAALTLVARMKDGRLRLAPR